MTQHTTTVYYNSACPVCDAGIRHHKACIDTDKVQWIDVHNNPDAVQGLGVSLEAVRERLHVVSNDQTMVGADAVAALWQVTPGRQWLARIMGGAGVRGFSRWLYNRFASALYRWNLRKGHWTVNRHAEANRDPAELARFSALADRWWNPNLEFRPLHTMNPVRLAWIDALAPLSGRKVVDIGCGGGILSEAMAAKGAQVTGVDLAEAPLAVARLHALRQGLEVRYLDVAPEDLAGQEAQSFDVVTCMEMLEHVPRPAEVIGACARLVKPGGWVFFSTINRSAASWLMAIVGAEYVLRLLPRGTHRWDRFVRPQELVEAAQKEGLVLKDQRGLGYNPVSRRFRLHGYLGVGYLLAFQRQPDAP